MAHFQPSTKSLLIGLALVLTGIGGAETNNKYGQELDG